METSRLIAGARQRSRDEIYQHAARAAEGFRRLGVAEGDVVALLLRNDFAYFEASLAAAQIGAYATPLNWHGTENEIGYCLRDSGAKVLVAHADLWRPVAAAVPSDCRLLWVPTPPEVAAAYGLSADTGHPPSGTQEWADWLQGFPPCPTGLANRGSMIYTSGTSGRPKGVRRFPLSGQNLLDMQSFVAAGLGLSSDGRMVVLMNGPMYHSAPNSYGLAALRLGAVIVLQPRFDPRGMLQLIDRHRVTHMHIVPTMMHRLLKLEPGVRRAYDMGSLVDVTHGAAPCPPEVKRGMIDWWGPVISEYYGSTETGLITRITASDARAKPGSVGKALPGVEIRIFSAQGKEVSQGAVGEVCLRSRFMPDFTYHGDPAKRHAMERNGFVTVGDVGHLDEEGYLFLSGRSSDMIVSGGVNIYPAEIEAALHSLPGVRDCAVFGIPDEEFGEAVCAYVQPDAAGPALSPQGIRDGLACVLSRFKIPKVIEIAADLPREDSGKIFKRRLRAGYWKALGREI